MTRALSSVLADSYDIGKRVPFLVFFSGDPSSKPNSLADCGSTKTARVSKPTCMFFTLYGLLSSLGPANSLKSVNSRLYFDLINK